MRIYRVFQGRESAGLFVADSPRMACAEAFNSHGGTLLLGTYKAELVEDFGRPTTQQFNSPTIEPLADEEGGA